MKQTQKTLSSFLLLFCLLFSAASQAWADGNAPVAENLELRTYRNVSVGGRLSAFDPEDDVISFTITTEPVKGSIELDENGCFVYTPRENKRGRDYFGYKAVDSEGNISQEATVIIRIEKQKKQVLFSDLHGKSCAYAATALSENGIFTGEQVGGRYCFFPDQSVTRGEFLCMCMALEGKTPVSAVIRTGYADDESIPAWLRGYSVAARAAGIAADTDALAAGEAITAAEAAVWLDRALGLSEVRYLRADESSGQACLNLSGHGIPTVLGSHILTRAEAAEMLAAALELRNR